MTFTGAAATALAVARRLLAIGFSVFPVPRPDSARGYDGKVPLIPWREFQTRLPTDAELVRWFRGQPMNVAVITGAFSGIAVIDADSRDALGWCVRHLPYTPWQTKTRKGYHLYYRHPGIRVPNRARIDTRDGRLAIDVRGDGGYVIAAGSLHATGIEYLEAGDWTAPREEVPVFWHGWLARPRKSGLSVTVSTHRPSGNVVERARKYLAAVPRPEIGYGSDAATLYVACRLVRGFALAPADAEALIWEWAGGRPGWTPGVGSREGRARQPVRDRTHRGVAMTRPDAFAEVDPTVCDICGRDACEEHLPPQPPAVGAAADRPEGERPAPASPLTFVCATKLLNMSAPVAIIEGVAWANALTVLAAESGTGKTFLLTGMGAHVSSDRDWHGRAVRHGSVAYVTYEGDAFGPRLRALRQDGDHQLDHLHMVRAYDPLSPVVTRDGGEMPSKGELDVYNALHALTRHLKANNLPPVVLLIIDTVRGSLSGSEDSSEHVSAYLRAVRRLMAALPGAAAILAHHTGWQDGETKRRRERGSSAWRGNCDATLYLEAGDYDAEHGQGELTLTVLKARDVEKSPSLFLLRQRIELHESMPGRLEPVTSCVITSDRRSFADRQAKRDAERMATTQAEADALDLKVLAKVRDCPAATSIDAIRQMLAVQKSKVEQSVARLLSDNQLLPGKRGAPYIITEAGTAALLAACR